jgi:hypothetical protein
MSFSHVARLAAAALALAACADRTTTTDPGGGGHTVGTPDDLPAGTPFISAASVSTETLAIGGAAGSYSVTVENPGSTQELIPLVVTVVQDDVQRVVRSHPIRCGGSSETCIDQASFVVSNSPGSSGTIVPGPAFLRLELKDGASVISHLDIAVTLVSPAGVTSQSR